MSTNINKYKHANKYQLQDSNSEGQLTKSEENFKLPGIQPGYKSYFEQHISMDFTEKLRHNIMF